MKKQKIKKLKRLDRLKDKRFEWNKKRKLWIVRDKRGRFITFLTEEEHSEFIKKKVKKEKKEIRKKRVVAKKVKVEKAVFETPKEELQEFYDRINEKTQFRLEDFPKKTDKFQAFKTFLQNNLGTYIVQGRRPHALFYVHTGGKFRPGLKKKVIGRRKARESRVLTESENFRLEMVKGKRKHVIRDKKTGRFKKWVD